MNTTGLQLFTKEEFNTVFTYHEFITSEYWERQKLLYYDRHNRVCRRCRSKKNIHLHHKVYPKDGRFLRLPDNAFVALCGVCHRDYHDKFGVRQNMQHTSKVFARDLFFKKEMDLLSRKKHKIKKCSPYHYKIDGVDIYWTTKKYKKKGQKTKEYVSLLKLFNEKEDKPHKHNGVKLKKVRADQSEQNCPSCDNPMLLKVRKKLTRKQQKADGYYSQWHYCVACKYILFDEKFHVKNKKHT